MMAGMSLAMPTAGTCWRLPPGPWPVPHSVLTPLLLHSEFIVVGLHLVPVEAFRESVSRPRHDDRRAPDRSVGRTRHEGYGRGRDRARHDRRSHETDQECGAPRPRHLDQIMEPVGIEEAAHPARLELRAQP